MTSDHDTIHLAFSGQRVDPLSPSVFMVVCRLFEVNHDSTVHIRLVISTQPLPVEQDTHCALQLLIVITVIEVRRL